jgi:hypothetical protein
MIEAIDRLLAAGADPTMTDKIVNSGGKRSCDADKLLRSRVR